VTATQEATAAFASAEGLSNTNGHNGKKCGGDDACHAGCKSLGDAPGNSNDDAGGHCRCFGDRNPRGKSTSSFRFGADGYDDLVSDAAYSKSRKSDPDADRDRPAEKFVTEELELMNSTTKTVWLTGSNMISIDDGFELLLSDLIISSEAKILAIDSVLEIQGPGSLEAVEGKWITIRGCSDTN
jgi:hypothetical protein